MRVFNRECQGLVCVFVSCGYGHDRHSWGGCSIEIEFKMYGDIFDIVNSSLEFHLGFYISG